MEYFELLLTRTATGTPPPVNKSKLRLFLIEKGYKPIPVLPHLFLNGSGHIFNIDTVRKLTNAEKYDILKNYIQKQPKKQPPAKRYKKPLFKTAHRPKIEFKRYLRENGYKPIPALQNLFINDCGCVFNLKTGKTLKPTKRNYIITAGKTYNVEKLLLLTFKNEPIRSGKIKYTDGNKLNLNASNLEYVTKYPHRNNINPEALKTAIRCYFEVEKKFNQKDYLQTRLYLKLIIKKRNFYFEYSHRNNIDIFKSYMSELTNSRAKVAKEYGISVRDCDHVINDFINLLINDILTDLNAGKLVVMEYLTKTTKTQEIRELNSHLIKKGYKPLPLRKLSDKEKARKMLKQWNVLLKKLDKKILELETLIN